MLTEGVDVFGKHCHCEQYKKPVIYCFDCQQFGHMPNTALESLSAATGYQKHNTCCNPSFFVNCNKEGHPSTSRDCPTVLSKNHYSNETSAI